MAASVTLTIHGGILDGKELVFKDLISCTVGRGRNCYFQLPFSPEYRDVSRHHCQFDIDPPRVGVRDLASLNGTFINEIKIGQRVLGQMDTVCTPESPSVPLKDGDRVKIGQMVLRVRISGCEELTSGAIPDEDAHCLRTKR